MGSMKGKLLGKLSSIVILFLLCSGIFANIVEFFAWLFTLQYSAPDTSITGGIIVRILTFVVSYGLVGIIFNALGLFNSKIMSIAYFIISALIGFALSFVVWKIEQHILIIGIVLGVIALMIVGLFLIRYLLAKRKSKNEQH